jgi:acyl transferase domain-containing protein
MTMDTAEVKKMMTEQLELSRRLRSRIRELERAAHAPAAVIGMGLRLPGSLRSPEDYWDFLCREGNAVTEIPGDRPGLRAVYDPAIGKPGRSYVDRAAFLDDIASFDAGFFGISQREAELLDPQQRMLLETAWEALERAGLAVRRADRLDVGVYLGMMASEYAERLAVRGDKTPIDPYYATGGGLCFGAGRISYVMGFRGPAVSMDTACSSSLTALHFALRALRDGDCRYALVCGSNLVLSPNLMVSLCQSRALAPDGRSKSFLASADGYGRGEGVGALLLMRLADAEQEQRPVLAVISGSAINHDGPAAGLTVPNGPAQQEVIRAALADAGVDAEELGWIEAHGTGTRLGDPAEIGALDSAVGAAIAERRMPLAIGSVKSRLGHLEAASGVAAVMKTVLMLQHGVIPPAAEPGDGELNPIIEWQKMHFTVPRKAEPWPRSLPRRIAGVNSFGMSGTNAHVVLTAYEPGQGSEPAAPANHPDLLLLSAKDPGALADLADAVGRYLKRADPALIPSVCHTLRVGRVPFSCRVAVTGSTGSELASQLTAALSRFDSRPEPVPLPLPLTVTLRVAASDEAVRAAATELADGLPALSSVPVIPLADPAESLAAILRRFGLRVQVRRENGLPGSGARVEWESGTGPAEHVMFPTEQSGVRESLLQTLGTLFAQGADLRWEDLRAPGARLVGDLPTYPFHRVRYWIDEIPVMPDDEGARPSTPAPRAASTLAVPSPANRDAVEAYLIAELRDVLHAPGDLDPAASFLEAGGDSFISTLYMARVEDRFAVSLTQEDLPIDAPLSVLIRRLAEDISGSAYA